MKKIDKLILGAFLGPFFLTFFVVIFILLSQFMLKYLDEIVGKDLDTTVIAQLIFYFSIFMTPNAFPLAVLLSSLMTFGNLGEHFELTALKGSGISLIRVMVPIFGFTLFLTVAAYYSNNFIVPRANLKAFSLLYDVKQMKPSMELKEGTFYNGIEGYSIKVGKKYPDGKTLKDLVIYDHTAGQGNRHVTMADSGQMYNILSDRYLVLEMFNGNTYREERAKRKSYLTQQYPEPLIRNEFKAQKIVFSLASFDLKRTKEELFSSNRLMKNAKQLQVDVDSMKTEYYDKSEEVKEHSFKFFDYHLQDIVGIYKKRAMQREELKRAAEEAKERELRQKEMEEDSSFNDLDGEVIDLEKSHDDIEKLAAEAQSDTSKKMPPLIRKVLANKKKQKEEDENVSLAAAAEDSNDGIEQDSGEVTLQKNKIKFVYSDEDFEKVDSVLNTKSAVKSSFNKSLAHVRFVKNNMSMRNGQLEHLSSEINKFQLERYKKLSYAITILIMFFIDTPLGSIIKRGGLGFPVLISLSFFILFYVIFMMCEKWTRTDVMDPLLAAWMANIILFPIGMFFMKQAKNDARLFDTDFYSVFFLKLKTYFFPIKSRF